MKEELITKAYEVAKRTLCGFGCGCRKSDGATPEGGDIHALLAGR